MLTFPLSLIACRMPVSESKISENFLFYRTFYTNKQLIIRQLCNTNIKHYKIPSNAMKCHEMPSNAIKKDTYSKVLLVKCILTTRQRGDLYSNFFFSEFVYNLIIKKRKSTSTNTMRNCKGYNTVICDVIWS